MRDRCCMLCNWYFSEESLCTYWDMFTDTCNLCDNFEEVDCGECEVD